MAESGCGPNLTAAFAGRGRWQTGDPEPTVTSGPTSHPPEAKHLCQELCCFGTSEVRGQRPPMPSVSRLSGAAFRERGAKSEGARHRPLPTNERSRAAATLLSLHLMLHLAQTHKNTMEPRWTGEERAAAPPPDAASASPGSKKDKPNDDAAEPPPRASTRRPSGRATSSRPQLVSYCSYFRWDGNKLPTR